MKLEQILKHDLGYNPDLKAEFKKAAMAALRKLAKDLKLPKESYDLRWNAGGIAVSGDAVLHHEHFYVHLSQSCCGCSPIYYRTCEGRKDYTGGQNQNATAAELEHGVLADRLKRMLEVTK